MSKGKGDINKKAEVLQGTLDLMILKTLQAMGPLHGFGIARRLEQLSEEVLSLNEGTVYTCLRFRDRPPAGAVERRSAQPERRHGLHLPAAAAAGGLDCSGVGRFGEQP